MSFSIYNLDEEIKALLSLDDFLGGLTVNEFVEELSKDHFLKGAEVNKLEYLDPKPYIRTFESALRELKQLSLDAESQKDHMEKQVNDYELKHSHNVLELSDKIEKITKQFSNLDFRISDVSTQIDPLNSSLNKITNSRDVSVETIFLIRAYHGFFTKQKYDPLENLRTSKRYDDRLKCATTVNNLLTLAKKIETPEISKTSLCVQAIEKFSETMERDLLNKFEVALENDEFEIMKEISSVLEEYNGGTNVIQTFVSKNDFLEINDEELGRSVLDDENVLIALSDPNYTEEVKDQLIEDLLDHLKMTIKGEARVVSQVFENPIPVLKIFIQRLYAQSIQSKVTQPLQDSLQVSSLAHVRVLQYLYQTVNDFTKDLKDFFLNNDFDTDNELSSILDQSFYDVFIKYTNDGAYFNQEKKGLEDLIYDVVSKFNSYNEQALNAKQLSTVLDNLNNLDYHNDANMHLSDKAFGLIERKRLNRFKDFMKSRLAEVNVRGRTSTDQEDTEEHKKYSNLNMSIVETVIKAVIETVARVLELEPNRSPEYALELLEILLYDFGQLYIQGGLEVTYDNMKQESGYSKVNSNNFIDFSYLASFTLISDILFLLSNCIKRIIIPCAVNNPSIRNRMINLTNSYIKRCEVSINVILNETIDLISSKLTYFLSRQKRKDFLADSLNNITEDDTEACELVSTFMNKTYEGLRKSLNDANLLNVLTKIGSRFLSLLLEHFKKFTVDSTGGVILTKDVIRYQSVIENWEIPELSENFQVLKEISNLFTVHPNLINSLVTEGQLASLKPPAIRQYVGKRADFNPSYIERFFTFR